MAPMMSLMAYYIMTTILMVLKLLNKLPEI